MPMGHLVNELIKNGYLKTDAIIEAFLSVGRKAFVPKELASKWDFEKALPIGYGQTISQPLTVALMLELLDPQKNQKILDVGSGSGWTTALLSHIVGPGGRVFALERIPELRKMGEENADKFGYVRDGRARFILADGTAGFLEEAPYDRILVSAAAKHVPDKLKQQLRIGGKMVIPMRQSIWYLEKKSQDEFYEEEYPGFAFVPLVSA